MIDRRRVVRRVPRVRCPRWPVCAAEFIIADDLLGQVTGHLTLAHGVLDPDELGRELATFADGLDR